MFGVLSYKKPNLDITATAEEMQAIGRKWAIEATVIDGANKQAVEELNNRHGLAANPADKTGKADFIDIMNGEFIQGRIKLSPDCQPLKDEYAGLIWDERALAKSPPKRVEHPGCENHCTDGELYGWRFCWQYLSEPLKKKPLPNSIEAWEEAQRQQALQVEQMIEQDLADAKAAKQERDELEGWQ